MLLCCVYLYIRPETFGTTLVRLFSLRNSAFTGIFRKLLPSRNFSAPSAPFSTPLTIRARFAIQKPYLQKADSLSQKLLTYLLTYLLKRLWSKKGAVAAVQRAEIELTLMAAQAFLSTVQCTLQYSVH